MEQFTIESKPGGAPGVRILKLTGPFLLGEVFDFQKKVREDPAPLTIIDLSGVPYMDSAALGSLLGFHVSCQREHRSYGLVGVSDRIRTLFRVAGVESFLSIYGSQAEAEAKAAAA